MMVWLFTQQQLYCLCQSHVNQGVLRGRQRHLLLSQTWVSVMFTVWATNCMKERLKLSRPVATVTDVLFNTRAGSSSSWSEYKLAHCLQEGESTANVATTYFTCKPIPLKSSLVHHVCSSHYFTCFLFHEAQRRPLHKSYRATQQSQQMCVLWI